MQEIGHYIPALTVSGPDLRLEVHSLSLAVRPSGQQTLVVGNAQKSLVCVVESNQNYTALHWPRSLTRRI